MKIQKGFLKKEVLEIKDGYLCKYSKRLFSRKKENEELIEIRDIEYIERIPLIKKIFNIPFLKKTKHVVEFISESSSLYVPNLKRIEIDNLISAILNIGGKQTEHKYMFIPSSKTMKDGYNMVCDLFGKMVHKNYTDKECTDESVDLEKVIYFDDIKIDGVKGISFGYVASGGYSNTIEVLGLSKSDEEKIRKMVFEKSPNLTDANIKIHSSIFPLFTFSRWFKKREKIILTQWGIIHKQYGVKIDNKYYKTRTSALFYKDIKSYIYSGGLFFKNMTILGTTTISTVEKFSTNVQVIIWRKIRENGIANDKEIGKKYSASFFHRSGQGKIILTPSDIIWIKGKEVKVLKYNQTYSYEFKKKHWFSFFGDATIRGCRTDARSGEGGDVVMEIIHMRSRNGKNLIRDIKEKETDL